MILHVRVTPRAEDLLDLEPIPSPDAERIMRATYPRREGESTVVSLFPEEDPDEYEGENSRETRQKDPENEGGGWPEIEPTLYP